MRIAVVCGGISPERNVSLNGGKAVFKALKELGHDVIAIDPARGNDCLIDIEAIDIPKTAPSIEEMASFTPKSLIECVQSEHMDTIDLAFLVVHGQYGEDGKIQALLELKGIPYTGSDIKSSAISINKVSSKMMFLAGGINTPNWVTVRKSHLGDYDYYEKIRDEIGNAMVVKPNDQGSTIGINILHSGNLDDIHYAIQDALKYSDKAIVEEYISGRELTVGIVNGEALPIIEIVPEGGFYDYESKYASGQTKYICPAEMDTDLSEFAQNLALQAYDVIGCSGFSRVDFRMNEDFELYCLEINTIPGFTSTSLVPKAAKEVGIEFPELCERIVNLAIEK